MRPRDSRRFYTNMQMGSQDLQARGERETPELYRCGALGARTGSCRRTLANREASRTFMRHLRERHQIRQFVGFLLCRFPDQRLDNPLHDGRSATGPVIR